MNTIIVDYEKVWPYFNDGTEKEFIFDYFKLYINFPTYKQLKYKIKLVDGIVMGEAKRIDDNGNEIVIRWVLSDGEYKNSYIKAACFINGNPAEKGYNKAVLDEVRNLTALLDGIMSVPRKKENKKVAESGIKRKTEEKDYCYKPKKVFLLDDIVEYINENGMSRTKHIGNVIKCPCWDVRGHYRHYKSGKTVFVKNYVKGKERNKEKPKEREYYI